MTFYEKLKRWYEPIMMKDDYYYWKELIETLKDNGVNAELVQAGIIVGKSRWAVETLDVFRDVDTNEIAGVYYNEPATEMQEGMDISYHVVEVEEVVSYKLLTNKK